MSDPTAGTVREGTTGAAGEEWKDGKKYAWLLGLVVPILPFLGILGATGLDWKWALWIGPIAIFVVIALLDVMLGLDGKNPPEEMIDELENNRYYRWVTYAYLPFQYAGLVAVMYFIAVGNPFAAVADLFGSVPSAGIFDEVALSVWDKIGIAITAGCVAGIGINTAHELGHKKESVERWLSKIALAQSFYGHFYIEHNRGHHVRVATPEDPASSRLGETFYEFWPRTVSGSLKSAWELEAKRYKRKGTHPFHIGNEVLNAWAMSVVLFAGLVAWLGIGVAPYLLINVVFGFSLLEVVNYLEHYGMLRQKVGPEGRQRYERVAPRHSWNSNNRVTNIFLYHLQRHSDHHANPTRRYQALRDFEEAPVLPCGYAGAIVLAVFPPVWRRVMDKKVLAHLGGDITLANIQPRKKAYYYKKYAAVRPEVAPRAAADDVTVQSFKDIEVLAAKCPGCSYVYEVAAGDEHEGWAAGTAWAEIPDTWCCPDCGVREKVDFIPVDPETLKVDAS
jgi:alkane 1-monooxygenase